MSDTPTVKVIRVSRTTELPGPIANVTASTGAPMTQEQATAWAQKMGADRLYFFQSLFTLLWSVEQFTDVGKVHA